MEKVQKAILKHLQDEAPLSHVHLKVSQIVQKVRVSMQSTMEILSVYTTTIFLCHY